MIAVPKKAMFATREKISQAAARPLLVMASVRMGMKAIASAPPEMRAKSRSGKLLAALNASN
jgi:hypothetical protein